MKLYLKYLSMHLKSLLEYGKTFIISCMGQIATSIFSFLSIIFLFDKFGNRRISSPFTPCIWLLWATARICSVARSTSASITSPSTRNTRYPRRRWRTRSSPPSSRRRRSISATPTSGAAARPPPPSTAPASSATSTTTAAWAGASGGWALRGCWASAQGYPPPTCAPAIWCSSKAPTTRRAHPMWAFTSAMI